MRRLPSLVVCAGAAAAFGLANSSAQAQQAPPAAPPAAPVVAQPVPGTGSAYRIFAETVTSGQDKTGPQGIPCVTQTVFFPGSVIVFRAVISDGPSGVELTADDVAQRGLKAVVTLSDGTKIPVLLKAHPPFPSALKESYWSGTLFLRPEHPTGTLPWTLTVTDAQGRTGTYTPPGQTAGVAVLTVAQRAPAAAK